MSFFITGTSGFIGFHLARRLLAEGHVVTGFDAMTPYYDVRLKRRRLELLRQFPTFVSITGQLEDMPALTAAITTASADIVIHLAAQAGVRYSIDHPQSYVSANLVGTANLLEALRQNPPRHLLFASSSSVYGGNEKVPFAETDRADGPISLYAATKKSGEAMTHAYAHLWSIPTTCFRFFTVYGPWGRPDMALFKFTAAIERGEPIEIYGQGQQLRDFTYVEDLVEAVMRLIDVPPEPGKAVLSESGDSLSPVAPWRVVNIAAGKPVPLMTFVETLELALGRTAIKVMLPTQPGDVVRTNADSRLLQALIGYVPQTDLATGIAAFVQWYRAYRTQNGDPDMTVGPS